MQETTTAAEKGKTWFSILVLCAGVFLAVLFSGGGVADYLGPSHAEKESKKQAYLTDRTLLLLQLSKCQKYAAGAADAYICPGSNVAYKGMAANTDCLLAEEAARTLGLAARDFSIPGTLHSGVQRSGTGTQ